MAPPNLEAALGAVGTNLVTVAIGIAFGAVLELAGFGNSRKLAAQFYLRDLTVLKVMFTAIIVAMVLIFAATGLGWLDYQSIWVNPTYLWPGIVGGLLMGVGFIIGGFCPGTSLVAVATAKLDGIFFAIGVLSGIFLFGETVDFYPGFFNSSFMGRFTVPQWLGLSTGTVVLLIVLMALGMFWGAERLERIFGQVPPRATPRLRYVGVGALVLAALAVLTIGQPTLAERWAQVAPVQAARLRDRQVQVEPAELVSLMHNDQINLVMLDVRSESDYNLFHLRDARRVDASELPGLAAELTKESPNTAVVLMSDDEDGATRVWKRLEADRVPNVYLLEGGLNEWLNVFGHEDHGGCAVLTNGGNDQLRHYFAAARGSRDPAASPEMHENDPRLAFHAKVKIEQAKAAKKGGCG